MGLVFPVHPDIRRSKSNSLLLSSSTKKFSVGGTFLFIGLVLAAMHLAAAPLFEIMWKQGTLFDKGLTAFFYGLIVVYPFVTAFCWFYKEKIVLTQQDSGELFIDYNKSFGPFKLKTQSKSIPSIQNLSISNWKGNVNMAAIENESKSGEDKQRARYATKGHWVLHLDDDPQWVIERRAKKEDIDWLMQQIDAFFSQRSTSI
ncbi:hypothetical protein GW916_11590 [bacterium]|nr:hypothetical protein [bacterium]